MRNVLVLLSGGQDSATCLAWAIQKFDQVHTLSIDYGQRHRIELGCSQKLSEIAQASSHTELKFETFSQLGDSALIGKGDITQPHRSSKDLPASFVPGRNYVFLGLAAAKAYQLGIHDIITGVCETDYSGYADCRDTSIKAIQVALSLCLDYNIVVHTPLMWKNKAETVLFMKDLGRLDWYKYTHTCYEGAQPPCGKCPACKLRAKGFLEAGIKDPLLEKN